MSEPCNDVSDWWTTEIIDMAPGQIRIRGNQIEDLIGNVSFSQMIFLMTRGELPTKAQADPDVTFYYHFEHPDMSVIV